jgi:hypothetical protein
MALKAGKADFKNSMAEAMEKVFNEQLALGPPKPADQMKMLFIAVAEGVVRHLVAHPEAFQITVYQDDINTHTTNVKISSTDSP